MITSERVIQIIIYCDMCKSSRPYNYEENDDDVYKIRQTLQSIGWYCDGMHEICRDCITGLINQHFDQQPPNDLDMYLTDQ